MSVFFDLIVVIVPCVFACFVIPLVIMASRGGAVPVKQWESLLRIERKLDVLLRDHGLEQEAQAALEQASAIKVPLEAEALVQAGMKINAIKLLRECNPGLGLKEAKDYVEGPLSHLDKR